MKKAHNALILSPRDLILREVSKEKTTQLLWAKLDKLYMEKSLHNHLYLMQILYAYMIVDDKSIQDQLDDFTKIIDDLDNIDV